MSEKNLKSLKFHGLDDIYKIPSTAEDVGAATPEAVNSAKTAAINEAKTYTNAQVKKAAPRNLLDNSDFTNPVNQRGFKSGTASEETYFIDRWLYSRISEGGMVEVKDGKVILSSAYIVQRLPLDRLDSTKKYTLVYTKADGTRKIENNPWIDFNHYGYGYHRVVLYLTNYTLVNVALYEGEYTLDTLPEYQPKGYAVELAECMRYYQYFPYMCTAFNQWSFVQGYMNFIVPMRISPPTVNIYSYKNKKLGYYTDASDSTETATAQVNNVNPKGFRAQGDGFTVGHIYQFYVEASADL